VWHYLGHGNGTSEYQRASCFERLPHLNLLKRFPDEGMKVLETRVPAGVRVILGPRQSSEQNENGD
jgi:hypothetical protein